MHTPRNAAIYCRLSYAPDGSLEKVERQEGDCRALGDRLDWGICCVYSDNNRSAWQRDRKRKDWDAMLAGLEPGTVCPRGNHHDGILVYHGDRLIRQPWDLELLLKLADDRQIPLASPSGTRDLNNEDDRFILRIEAAQACKASADTSRRVKRGIAARTAAGRPPGAGNRPFGYGIPTGELTDTGHPRYDLTQQVPEEAGILRTAAERILAGESRGSVRAWMNTVSTTTLGNAWSSRSFTLTLLMPRIAGLIELDGELYPGSWEPIISREQWEDLRALQERNGEAHGWHGRDRRYLLSGANGAAQCSGCGGPLSTKPTGGRNRKTSRLYYCRDTGCPAPVSRNVDHLDAYVSGRVVEVLNDDRFLAQLHAVGADERLAGVGAEIAALKRRRREAAATFEDLADHPDVDPALLLRSLASFDHKITSLRGRVARTTRERLLRRVAGFTREQWDAEPVGVRAEVARLLFRVRVLPAVRRGPGFDPGSVQVTELWMGE